MSSKISLFVILALITVAGREGNAYAIPIESVSHGNTTVFTKNSAFVGNRKVSKELNNTQKAMSIKNEENSVIDQGIKKIKIYWAASLFSAGEILQNLVLSKELKNYLEETYRVRVTFNLPQNLQLEAASDQELVKLIYEKDFDLIAQSDALLFLADGADLDSGAVVEYTRAKYGMQIPVLLVRTDMRKAELGALVNPMLLEEREKFYKIGIGPKPFLTLMQEAIISDVKASSEFSTQDIVKLFSKVCQRHLFIPIGYALQQEFGLEELKGLSR